MAKENGRKPKEKRYDSTFATILRELLRAEKEDKGVNLEDVAKALGVTRQSLAQYRDGNNIPDVVLLSRMAKYFEVSTDYLLGRTPNKTTNTELQAVCEYMGLSEKAVENIKTIQAKKVLGIFNKLCETVEFSEFVDSISNLTISRCAALIIAREYRETSQEAIRISAENQLKFYLNIAESEKINTSLHCNKFHDILTKNLACRIMEIGEDVYDELSSFLNDFTKRKGIDYEEIDLLDLIKKFKGADENG